MPPRSHRELREAFLRYFERHDHRRVASAPLVPQDDPTLLFVNAGMVPFKKYFLGEARPPYPRVTSCQKCVRAGGKHNDLEQVGYTARHHTFFEMLGNFSFGDYFKCEAISFAWRFLTEEIGLPVDRLWVTVFHEDDEARRIWREEIGVPAERVLDGDEADNFWSMGDTGPCGPCSEIHYDQGPGDHWHCPDPAACGVFCECDRFLEVWNLVFMQYDRQADGTLVPLPNPSIDTGMGLERLAAVVQGVTSNYDTDLFRPILAAIGSTLGTRYGEDEAVDVAMRVVADHARATAFLIADGVLPSNEGRGYVLRRIMRRAIRYGRKLGRQEPFLAEITKVVVAEMGEVYPELRDAAETIARVVTLEEERFGATLEQGLRLFDQALAHLRESGGTVLPGAVAFQLYDTYGFPLDLTELLAREAGVTVDREGFEAAMAEQRRRAKADRAAAPVGDRRELLDRFGPTEFVGYDVLEAETPILAILDREGRLLPEAEAPAEVEILLARTPFYAEGGGQLADRGWLHGPRGRARVEDVQKVAGALWVHRLRVEEGRLAVDEPVRAVVDRSWREPTRAHHTATHMFHAALREILGRHVRQAGSLVAPERLRFDFSHYAPMAPEERNAIEELVNVKIREDLPVRTREMPYDEAIAAGALAFFGDKYGDVVRVVEIPGYSVELCGGTHVERTGQIGVALLEQEGGVAAGVRRIEAAVGSEALRRVRHLQEELETVAERLGVPTKDLVRRVDQILETVESQRRELERLRQTLAGQRAAGLETAIRGVGPYRVLAVRWPAQEMRELIEAADELKQRFPETVIFLASPEGERPLYFATVPKALQGSLHAGELLRTAAAAAGGRGGGRAGSAQGGGGDPARVDAAIAAFLDAVARAG